METKNDLELNSDVRGDSLIAIIHMRKHVIDDGYKKFIAINCNGHKKGINKSEPPRILHLIHIHVTHACHIPSCINLLTMKFLEKS